MGASVGASLARNFIGWGPTAVPADFDTNDPLQTLSSGDTVKVLGGVRSGDVYEYLGDADESILFALI